MDRYSRHFNLPGFTVETQRSLAQKSVVVIGAGGLGNPVLQYLSAAGVGNIHIIDHDRISISNLHRQVLFSEKNIGDHKAKIAAEALHRLNSDVNYSYEVEKIDKDNSDRLLSHEYDLIIDASDNFDCRYAVDSFSQTHNIPLIYGAIHRFEGQVSVFNYQNGPSYHDLFPSAPEDGMVDNCDINGVLGPVAGLIGNLMAIEALKVLTGIGKVLSGELLVLQLDDFSSVKMKIPKQARPLDLGKKELVYHSISSFDLKKAIHEKEKLQLVDVRIPEQYQEKHIKGSINIPYDEILSRLNEISRDQEVIMICNIGQASMNVIRYLQNELNYTNLINLDGGVYAYFNE